MGDQEKNKYVFDQLRNQKEIIEGELGQEISWERLDNKRASRLALYTDGAIDDADADLERVKSWHIENLLKLRASLGSKIGALAKSAASM